MTKVVWVVVCEDFSDCYYEGDMPEVVCLGVYTKEDTAKQVYNQGRNGRRRNVSIYQMEVCEE